MRRDGHGAHQRGGAYAPTGLEGMEPKSIKKKMKDKAFAASVNRDNIRQCSDAGLELDDFLALSIEAMHGKAAELGLSK